MLKFKYTILNELFILEVDVVTDNKTIRLDTLLVGDIEGRFFIPDYQRGYRWGKEEVTRLLDDIYFNGDENYCLQPIVVKKTDNGFEVIDGQQRLTTIYLIYQYWSKSINVIPKPQFSLTYQTRKKSAEFLDSLDPELREENIDYWFIYTAYQAISDWFGKHDLFLISTKMYAYLKEKVKVIWYEIGESENPNALFQRLNIGKIPLTSAELVKAMFLSDTSQKNGLHKNKMDSNPTGSKYSESNQIEISLQWDLIESELHNDAFWYFLTNQFKTRYQTRIDLLLDLISGKTEKEKDTYSTFFYFDRLRSEMSLPKLWSSIYHIYLILKDWFENHEFYHKIGYLIASETLTLKQIYEVSQNKTKDQFREELDNQIKKSVAGKNYLDLDYENATDSKAIYKLLLLFNVESVRQNGEQSQWFPFAKSKFTETGKVTWTLEHIHAQNSEGLRKQEVWREWIQLHLPSVQALGDNDHTLLADMKDAESAPDLNRSWFNSIHQRVIDKFSTEGNTEFMHSISNLALLNINDNAALSNSTFDVKRNAIVKMDKAGQYIPFCTKKVFLKYYTPSEENQLHFWGEPDRRAYMDAIKQVLKNYITQEKNFIQERV